jgi:hypothetical protein
VPHRGPGRCLSLAQAEVKQLERESADDLFHVDGWRNPARRIGAGPPERLSLGPSTSTSRTRPRR